MQHVKESVLIKRSHINCQITHPTKKVYNIAIADYRADIILEFRKTWFPSKKRILISTCANFRVMFDEASGWSETSSDLEKHEGIPIIKLNIDFLPAVFDLWHKSLFTGKIEI